MGTYLRIFTILTPKQRRICGMITIVMFIGAVFEAVGVGAILPVIALMGEPEFLQQHMAIARIAARFGVYTHEQFIICCAGLLIVFYMIKNLYLAWEFRLQIDFAIDNQMDYATKLLARYFGKPYLYHLEHNTAILLRNVTNIGPVVFISILIPTLTLLTEVFTVIAIWVALLFIDAFVATVVVGVMAGAMYVILRSFRKKIAEQGKLQNDYSADMIKCLQQGLGAIKETKVLQKEKYFLRVFDKANRVLGHAQGNFQFWVQVPRMFIETIAVVGILLLIIIKLVMGYNPLDIMPILAVLALAAFRMLPSANRIVSMSNGIRFQLPFFDEVYQEVLSIRTMDLQQILSKETEIKPMNFQREIRVEQITFHYPKVEQNVFENISFTIPKGAFAGIIGPSGAGKTTFIDILLGLLDPTDGHIWIDEEDLHRNSRAWQQQIAYVPQGIYLTDGSIRENVALGVANEDIDDDRVEEALRMAELHDFVATLPAGVNTSVGECGSHLSGGQRQRIGIARAFYNHPAVLILDEATSALDNETEKSIMSTILKLKGKLTIIAIAHRLSTLEEADFKIRFEAGRAEVCD